MAISITGLFKPNGYFPLVEDVDLLGGFRIIENTDEMNNIPNNNRKAGMICFNREDKKIYQLDDDLTTWNLFAGAGGNSDGWEGEVETYDDLPDPADHPDEQWLVQKAQGSWITFNRKKAGLYESRDDGNGNYVWFYLGVKIHKVTEDEKTQCIDEVRRFSVKDVCDIAENHNLWKQQDASTGIGQELTPKNDPVQRVQMNKNVYGIVEMNVTNSNNSDNYAGASFVASINSEDYKDQVFLTMYATSFYQSYLAGKGANFTDRQLVIGAYGSNAQFDIAFGSDFAHIRPYIEITKTKFDMVYSGQKIYYEYGKTPQDLQPTDNILVCNSSTREVRSVNIPVNSQKVIMIRKGSELSSKNYLFLGRYMYAQQGLFKVYVNDEEYGNATLENTTTSQKIGIENYYTHMKFGDDLNDDDVIRIEYVEPISLGEYKVVLNRVEGDTHNIRVNPRMITQTITDSEANNYYLDTAYELSGSKLDKYRCVYRRFDGSGLYISVDKVSPNAAYLAEFTYNEDLPDGYSIEVWHKDNKGGHNLSTNRLTRLVPLKEYKKNLIDWFPAKNGTYHIRLKYDDGNGTVVYSPFLDNVISYRSFPVFTTDITLSEKEYKGTYYLMKIV